LSKIGVSILSAILSAVAVVAILVLWLVWGVPGGGQPTHIDPTRADYVDLLLTVVTIFLGAVGLVVTVGALVIGLVALKTLREIKEEAANEAKKAAAAQINETMASELEPNVKVRVQDALPAALPIALLNDELGHKILSDMAQRGELDEVLERVAMRMQVGGPEEDPEAEAQYTDEEGGQA